MRTYKVKTQNGELVFEGFDTQISNPKTYLVAIATYDLCGQREEEVWYLDNIKAEKELMRYYEYFGLVPKIQVCTPYWGENDSD